MIILIFRSYYLGSSDIKINVNNKEPVLNTTVNITCLLEHAVNITRWSFYKDAKLLQIGDSSTFDKTVTSISDDGNYYCQAYIWVMGNKTLVVNSSTVAITVRGIYIIFNQCLSYSLWKYE